MIIAVTVTFLSKAIFKWVHFVLIFILVGGSVGAFIAYRIPMTAMPISWLVHSLVGLAAVFLLFLLF